LVHRPSTAGALCRPSSAAGSRAPSPPPVAGLELRPLPRVLPAGARDSTPPAPRAPSSRRHGRLGSSPRPRRKEPCRAKLPPRGQGPTTARNVARYPGDCAPGHKNIGRRHWRPFGASARCSRPACATAGEGKRPEGAGTRRRERVEAAAARFGRPIAGAASWSSSRCYKKLPQDGHWTHTASTAAGAAAAAARRARDGGRPRPQHRRHGLQGAPPLHGRGTRGQGDSRARRRQRCGAPRGRHAPPRGTSTSSGSTVSSPGPITVTSSCASSSSTTPTGHGSLGDVLRRRCGRGLPEHTIAGVT
ncbi:unnamed protein product, partial [Urochloa humidicola]